MPAHATQMHRRNHRICGIDRSRWEVGWRSLFAYRRRHSARRPPRQIRISHSAAHVASHARSPFFCGRRYSFHPFKFPTQTRAHAGETRQINPPNKHGVASFLYACLHSSLCDYSVLFSSFTYVFPYQQSNNCQTAYCLCGVGFVC